MPEISRLFNYLDSITAFTCVKSGRILEAK